jgi:hypothetical protein
MVDQAQQAADNHAAAKAISVTSEGSQTELA